ncbi:MAG: cation:proton antiporter [Deltaproteobacteria bacterium]|nr:cation:proton antiporter [Deltaproteobacteria bacterium]
MELIDLNLFNFLKTAHPLFYIGLLLLFSYAGGKVANCLKAPRVTGYLVTGMLLSPSLLGLFHERLVKEDLTLITDIALAIIAFSIGGSLSWTKLKKLGKQILCITLTEASGSFLVTTVSLTLFFYLMNALKGDFSCFWTLYFPMALIIGAISAATAPAATLAIIHEYRAKGPFTTTLLGVVALDDALAIIFAAFAITIAQSFVNHEAITLQNFLFSPLFSILISLCIGGGVALCLRNLIRFVPRGQAMLGVMLGSVFLTAGLAVSLKVSPLLANMMLGFVLINFVDHHESLFSIIENIEEPIFGMFFALAGAHLDFGVMQTAGLLSLVITIGRFSGKLMGTRLGTQISHAPQTVKKYLGFGLLPTAGVTVGLVLEAKGIFGSSYLSEIMVNSVLGSVILNELLSPFFVRFSLIKAGEAVQRESELK